MSEIAGLISGLVSVSFRALDVSRIVALATQAKLATIEWGGDVHVPHGNLAAARDARRLVEDAGIACSAYGSYYRVGADASRTPRFEEVLATALELGAPSIRVWAGVAESASTSADDRARVERDLVRICTLAARSDVDISLEYHGGTLTDTPESTVALLRAATQPNLSSYWQPRHGLSIEENLADIAVLKPYLRNVHAFHWWPDGSMRYPLADGTERWRHYLAAIDDGTAHVVSLEFVRNDDEQQLLADAQALHALLRDRTR